MNEATVQSGNIAGEVPECQQCKVLGWWVGSRESDERTWVPVTNWVSEDVIGDREDGGSISLSAALLDTPETSMVGALPRVLYGTYLQFLIFTAAGISGVNI